MASSSSAVGRYRQNLAESMQMLAGSGAQQREGIASRYRADLGGALQDAIGRGLSGSTVLSSMRRGAGRDRDIAYGNLNQRLLDQRQQVYAQHSGNLAEAMQQEQFQQMSHGLSQARLGLDQRRFGLEQQRFNLQRRTTRRAYASPPASYTASRPTSRRVYSPLPGSVGGMSRNRAYQRINRQYG